MAGRIDIDEEKLADFSSRYEVANWLSSALLYWNHLTWSPTEAVGRGSLYGI
jgi:hypothetical protein